MSAVTPGSVAASPGAGYPPISLATAVAASKFRSLTTTRAPAAASPRASARPIPAPAPVTTAPAPAISIATPAGYRDVDHPIKAVPARSGRSRSRWRGRPDRLGGQVGDRAPFMTLTLRGPPPARTVPPHA